METGDKAAIVACCVLFAVFSIWMIVAKASELKSNDKLCHPNNPLVRVVDNNVEFIVCSDDPTPKVIRVQK